MISILEFGKKGVACGSPCLLPEVFDDSVQFRADVQDFVQSLLPLALDLLLAAEATPSYTGQPHAHGRHTFLTCPKKTVATLAQQFRELLRQFWRTTVRESRRFQRKIALRLEHTHRALVRCLCGHDTRQRERVREL